MPDTEHGIVTPTPAQVRRHDLELGMFFHFDIPVYKQGWEWRTWKDLPAPDLYQPRRLDTDQWMLFNSLPDRDRRPVGIVAQPQLRVAR